MNVRPVDLSPCPKIVLSKKKSWYLVLNSFTAPFKLELRRFREAHLSANSEFERASETD